MGGVDELSSGASSVSIAGAIEGAIASSTNADSGLGGPQEPPEIELPGDAANPVEGNCVVANTGRKEVDV